MRFLPLAVLMLLFLGLPCVSAASIHSFACVLQADAEHRTRAQAVEMFAKCDRDWLIIDGSYNSEAGGAWTPDEVEAMRHGKTGRKVIAYLSIGEAEEYRPYWQSSWGSHAAGGLTKNAPPFLVGGDPDWPGDYPVKYWQPAWQKIVLAQIDALMAAGYDGLYLDIVDGFETFEREGDDWIDDRVNPETGRTYRVDMIDWIKTIAAHARAARPGALIIPQNAAQLLAHPDYLQTIDGVGLESTFYDGNKRQKPAATKYVLSFLDPLTAAGKPVLLIEYVRQPPAWPALIQEAARCDYWLLITDRELKTLGQSPK